MRLKGSIAAALGVALAMTIGTAALGHDARFSSTTTIAFTDDEGTFLGLPADPDDTFTGTVTSERKSCVSARTVRVFKKGDGTDTAVGSDETDKDGKWTVTAEDPGSGTYYARIGPKVMRKGGHLHVCPKGRSKPLAVEDETELPI